MAKREAVQTISLDEFVKNIKRQEAKAGFFHIMAPQKRITRTQKEWERLFQLFMTRPLNVPWETWTKKGGK